MAGDGARREGGASFRKCDVTVLLISTKFLVLNFLVVRDSQQRALARLAFTCVVSPSRSGRQGQGGRGYLPECDVICRLLLLRRCASRMFLPVPKAMHYQRSPLCTVQTLHALHSAWLVRT